IDDGRVTRLEVTTIHPSPGMPTGRPVALLPPLRGDGDGGYSSPGLALPGTVVPVVPVPPGDLAARPSGSLCCYPRRPYSFPSTPQSRPVTEQSSFHHLFRDGNKRRLNFLLDHQEEAMCRGKEEQGAPATLHSPDASRGGPLPPVTEEELMNSGHELPHEGYTCPLCCLPIALPVGKALQMCAFCRMPTPNSDTVKVALIRKRVDAKDPVATGYLAQVYYNGDHGLQQDVPRAIELWTDAARLGDLDAHCMLGCKYYKGEGVEQDVARGVRHWQHAAIQGDPESRYILGVHEYTNRKPPTGCPTLDDFCQAGL
ncbi:hypothetical protein THAOC_07655, partial [Thalassiosira oceanica]